MQKIAVALLVYAVGVFTVATAEEAAESPWSGDVTLGYVKTTGNTEESTADADFKVLWTAKPWGHELKGRGYGATSDGSTTAESYQLAWKSTFDFTEFNYAFGSLAWNKDRFSGYKRQTFATVGYGRRILNDETFILNAEVGVGYTKQRTAEVAGPPVIPSENQDDPSASLGGDFTWNISETSAFEQNLHVFVTSENNFWQSVSKLRADIIGNLGLALSYTIKQNSDVPDGTDKTDTLTSIGLTYAF